MLALCYFGGGGEEIGEDECYSRSKRLSLCPGPGDYSSRQMLSLVCKHGGVSSLARVKEQCSFDVLFLLSVLGAGCTGSVAGCMAVGYGGCVLLIADYADLSLFD